MPSVALPEFLTRKRSACGMSRRDRMKTPFTFEPDTTPKRKLRGISSLERRIGLPRLKGRTGDGSIAARIRLEVTKFHGNQRISSFSRVDIAAQLSFCRGSNGNDCTRRVRSPLRAGDAATWS